MLAWSSENLPKVLTKQMPALPEQQSAKPECLDQMLPVRHHWLIEICGLVVTSHCTRTVSPFGVLGVNGRLHFRQVQVFLPEVARTWPESQSRRWAAQN